MSRMLCNNRINCGGNWTHSLRSLSSSSSVKARSPEADFFVNCSSFLVSSNLYKTPTSIQNPFSIIEARITVVMAVNLERNLQTSEMFDIYYQIRLQPLNTRYLIYNKVTQLRTEHALKYGHLFWMRKDMKIEMKLTQTPGSLFLNTS